MKTTNEFNFKDITIADKYLENAYDYDRCS